MYCLEGKKKESFLFGASFMWLCDLLEQSIQNNVLLNNQIQNMKTIFDLN